MFNTWGIYMARKRVVLREGRGVLCAGRRKNFPTWKPCHRERRAPIFSARRAVHKSCRDISLTFERGEETPFVVNLTYPEKKESPLWLMMEMQGP